MTAKRVADHLQVVGPDTGGNSHLELQKKKKWLKAEAGEIISPSEEDTA